MTPPEEIADGLALAETYYAILADAYLESLKVNGQFEEKPTLDLLYFYIEALSVRIGTGIYDVITEEVYQKLMGLVDIITSFSDDPLVVFISPYAFVNGGGYIIEEVDPTVASWIKAITELEIASWNAASPSSRNLTIQGTARVSIAGGTQDLSADRTWTVDLLSSGVTIGTYKSVTVDTYGRVTNGTNPTTLAGFGITDAYTKTEGDARYPQLTGSYSNPSWITGLAWSKISSTPTTLAGYGITDSAPASRTLTINGTTFDLSANRTWTIPTVTSLAALTDVTLTSPSGGQLLKYDSGTSKWINWTPTFSGDFIQNQNSSAQSTSNYWISGNGIYGTNPSSTGVIRMPNQAIVGWRNGDNSGDITITVENYNQFTFSAPVNVQQALAINRALSGNASVVSHLTGGSYKWQAGLQNSATNYTIREVGSGNNVISISDSSYLVSLYAGLTVGATATLTTSPTTSASGFEVITRNTSTGVIEKKSSSFYMLNPLTTNGDIVYGVGSTPTRLAAGSATQVLHGGTAPSWSAVSLTADVSGILPIANGGTGSGTQNFVDLTTTQSVAGAKTFTSTLTATNVLNLNVVNSATTERWLNFTDNGTMDYRIGRLSANNVWRLQGSTSNDLMAFNGFGTAAGVMYVPITFNSTIGISGTLTGAAATFSGLITSTVGNNANILKSNSGTTGYQFIDIQNTSGRAQMILEGSSAGTTATGSLAYASLFGSATTTAAQLIANGTVGMTLLSGGNVGIGTTNPLVKLAVSNSGAEGLEFGPGYISGRSVILAYNRTGGTQNGIDFGGTDFTFSNNITAVGYSKFWDGTQGLLIGAYSLGSGIGAIYSTGVTPSGSNYGFATSGTSSYLNANTTVYLTTAGTPAATITSSAFTSAVAMVFKGVNPGGIGANASVMDFSGNTARLFSYGSDASTNGAFSLISQRSDGSNSVTALSISSSQVATFSGAVNIGGTGSGKLNVTGVDGTTSYISTVLNSGTSGYGNFIQMSDGATYNLAFGTKSTSGDFGWYSGRFPGTAGTLIGTLTQAGALSISSTISTQDPTSGQGPAWRLGAVKTVVSAVLTLNYIEVNIAGTTYKIPTIT